jgi:hypothetical protein
MPEPLAQFYATLERLKARHFERYLDLAHAAGGTEAERRLAVIAAREAALATRRVSLPFGRADIARLEENRGRVVYDRWHGTSRECQIGGHTRSEQLRSAVPVAAAQARALRGRHRTAR